MTLLQSGITKSAAADAYTIDQSLRFNDGDSAYLSRTQTAGNRKTWTWSCWLKRGAFGNIDVFGTPSEGDGLRFYGTGFDNLNFLCLGSGGAWIISNAEYRDPSAWYHLVVAFDTTESVAADRLKLWVNGVQVTSFSSSSYPAEDSEFKINESGQVFSIGKGHANYYIDGYLAEVYFIDGTAYDADDFGETDSATNQWKPIDASGLTFGTNGFYLKFEDSADLGNDSSGEGNDYTVTNLVATDQMVDSPTNNFCTISPVDASSDWTISEGNTKCSKTSGGHALWRSTMGVDSGKWYWEFLCTAVGGSAPYIGCQQSDDAANGWAVWLGNTSSDFSWSNLGYTYDGGVGGAVTFATWGVGDILGFAVDCDGATLKCYKNNVLTGTLSNLIANKVVIPAGSAYSSTPIQVVNFGSDSSFAGAKTAQNNQDGNGVGDFYYEPPTDYLALCTSNLPNPEIKLPGENFNTIIWTGTSGARDFTGVGFQPDLVWDKSRDDTVQYNLLDSIRGAGKTLASNTDNPDQDDYGYGYIDSFDTDGFSTTTGEYNNYSYNKSGDTYVAWNWLAAASNAANAIGSLSSVVRANTTAGFSIVTYTGTGSLATVGHGLSAAPELVIIKNRTTTARSWAVGTTAGVDFTYVAYLNATNAFATDSAYFNDADPSPSVFTINTNNYVNNSGDDYVAYCFHSVEGYSKVGSYEGNGSTDGPFLYCGFRPAFLLTKETSGTGNWRIKDDKRDTYNVMEDTLYPNSSTAELDENDLDFVSNGVKLRNSGGEENADGDDYIFMAFAESPFKYANAR